MHCSRWLAMLCMDPGNCKEWKEAHGDDAQAPLICQPADSNQCNSRHPGLGDRASCEKSQNCTMQNKCWVSWGLGWASSHLSHRWFLRMRSFGAANSGGACHRPRITGGTDAHSFEADQQESFWGCQLVHYFDEPKLFGQFVRIADKKNALFHC